MVEKVTQKYANKLFGQIKLLTCLISYKFRLKKICSISLAITSV